MGYTDLTAIIRVAHIIATVRPKGHKFRDRERAWIDAIEKEGLMLVPLSEQVARHKTYRMREYKKQINELQAALSEERRLVAKLKQLLLLEQLRTTPQKPK